MSRAVFQNVRALAIARAATMVTSLVTFSYLSRQLSPAQFGVLNWTLALVAVFGLALSPGLHLMGTRLVARDARWVPRFSRRFFEVRVWLLPAVLLAYAAVVGALVPPGEARWVAAVLGAGLVGSGLTLYWVYAGLNRMATIAQRNVGASLLAMFGALLLVRGPEDLVVAAATMVGATLLADAWFVVSFGREFGLPRPRLRRGPAWDVFARSLPVTASLAMLTVFATTDRLMVGYFCPEEEVGYYAVAHRLTVAALVPADVLAQAFLPVLAAAKGRTSEMVRTSEEFARALLFAGTPVLIGTALLAGPLVVLFSGESFAPAAPMLVLLMSSAAASYVGKGFGDSLLAWDQDAPHARALAGGAVANVLLNVLLVPRWGGTGAALATAVATALVALRFGWLYRRTSLTLHGSLLARAGIAGALGVALPTVAVSHVGWPWPVAVCLSVVGYILAALLMGLVPPSLVALAKRASSYVRR